MRAVPAPVAGALVLVLALAAGAPAAPGDRTVKVYDPRHRPAEELLPLARAAIGAEGQALVDRGTNSLLLVGSDAALAETLELLHELDRALRTVVLRYESQRLDSLEARGIRIDWSAGTGDVRIGNAVFPEDRQGVRLRSFAVGTEREGGLAGVVRVLEGQRGRITTGRSVPVTRRSRWDVDTTWVTAESGFEARPRILDDGRVQVDLFPSEQSVDRRGELRFLDAATRVTVRPGETVVVGAVDRTSRTRASSGSRTYAADQKARMERVLLLSVRVEGGEDASPAKPH